MMPAATVMPEATVAAGSTLWPSRVARRFSGILARITLLALFGVLPIAGALMQALVQTRATAVQRAISDIESSVRAEAASLEQAFASLEQLVSALSVSESNAAGIERCSTRLLRISRASPYLLDLFISDLSGDVVCISGPVEGPAKPANVADRPYFDAALRTGEAVYGVLDTSSPGRPVLPVAIGIVGESGSVVGVAGGGLDILEGLSRAALNQSYDEMVIALWDDEGRLIGRFPRLDGEAGRAQPDKRLLNVLLGSAEGFAEVEGLDGVERLYTVAAVELGDRKFWLTAGVAREVVLSDFDSAFVRQLGLFGIAFVFVLISAALIGEYTLRRPIARLSRSALQLAGGDTGARSGIVSGARELVELGRNFDGMAEQLQRRIESQAKANEELEIAKATVEKKVNERTEELKERTVECERISAGADAQSAALKKASADLAILSEMADLLQTASGLDEVDEPIQLALQRLYPANPGAVCQFRESRDRLQLHAVWGGFVQPAAFPPDDCLAIRLGRPYTVAPGEQKPRCRHIDDEILGYTCRPMSAQGNVLGVLSIELAEDEAANHKLLDLAQLTAEHLSLALANLRLRQQLRDASIRDVLTGLYNRRFCEEMLARELPRAKRDNSRLSILMLDVDHFKQVNDTFGHSAGDRVLHEIGAMMQNSFRGGDVCCRYGGEEFLIVLPSTDVAGAKNRAERLREDIKRISFDHNGSIVGPVTVSIGVATFPEPVPDGEIFVAAADTALYRAKDEGRDRVVVATAEALHPKL